MSTTTLKVSGMTCGHCITSVTSELKATGRVSDVAVDLHPDASSVVTVSHEEALSIDQMASAIAKAGYNLEEVTAQS